MRTANIISPAGRHDARVFLLRERARLRDELREKYRVEFQQARGWTLIFLKLRIHREASQILRHRLYLDAGSAAATK